MCVVGYNSIVLISVTFLDLRVEMKLKSVKWLGGEVVTVVEYIRERTEATGRGNRSSFMLL